MMMMMILKRTGRTGRVRNLCSGGSGKTQFADFLCDSWFGSFPRFARPPDRIQLLLLRLFWRYLLLRPEISHLRISSHLRDRLMREPVEE